MRTLNFNLRGVAPEVMSQLKAAAKKQKTSVNLLIIKILENNLGYSPTLKKPIYHDLDKLAGTWSAKDMQNFEKHTKEFEKIDKDLWV